MGSSHGDPGLRVGRVASVVLGLLVAAVAAGTVAGLVALRPDGDVVRTSRVPSPYVGLVLVDGTVSGVRTIGCDQVGADGAVVAGAGSPTAADGGPVGTADGASVGAADGGADCAVADVRTAGRQVVVPVPVELVRAGLGAGDPVRLARYPAADGAPETYAFVGYQRQVPLVVLAVAFTVLVVLVARWKGLAALVGAGVALGVLATFTLPALRLGTAPLPVALVTACAVMVPVLYLVHGVSARTSTALLGTVAGLAVTAALAAWATGAAHLDGLVSDEDFELNRLTTGTGLAGVVLCGAVVAGLGVLNDVTITQASAVWEVKAHAPHLGVARLFASGMRVGRDHLASTVYTILFAYAGAAMPTLLLADVYAQPLGQMLTGADVAEEVVRTLVAAIGLVLAIPLTTFVAALVAAGARPRSLDVTVPDAAKADDGQPVLQR